MAALLRKHAEELISQGRHQLVGQWLAQIPDELFDAEPWLAYWHGVCRIFASAPESEAWMERAFRRFKETEQVEGIYRAWCGVCRAIRLMWGNYALYDPWIEELNALLAEHSEFPAPMLECQVMLDAVGALHWRNPNHPKMRDWTERALVLADELGVRSLQVGAHTRAVYGALLYDEMPKAGRHVEYLERALARRVDDLYVDIAARHVRGLYACAVGRFAQAAEIFHELIEQAHSLGLFTWDVYLYVWHGLAKLVRGDLIGAAEARDKLRNAPGIQGAFGAFYYHKLCADIALDEHEIQQAMRHAREALAAAEQAGTPFMRTWALNTLATVHVMAGLNGASDDLDTALTASRDLGSRWMEINALTGRALYTCLHDSPDAAKRALQVALELMRHQACVGLAQAPEATRLLAIKALEYGVETDHARKILEAYSGSRAYASPAYVETWPWPLKVYTLGSFRLMKYGVTVSFGRKPPRRPLQLLKVLITLGGCEVPETHVLDALWPDEEADAARNAFSTALNRLRKIVGADVVRLKGGKLRLDTARCWVDAWAFEAILNQAGSHTDAVAIRNSLRVALELYKGNFLAEDAEAPWSMPARERLQRRYAEAVARLAADCQREGDHEGAVALFRQGLAMDELREDYYQGLMRSYLKLNRPDEARQTFEFCQRRLSIRQKRKPSAPTVALFELVERQRRE
jgi:DNA-binding SARP family transcriptional activator